MAENSGSEQCDYVFNFLEWQQNNGDVIQYPPSELEEVITDRNGVPVWQCPHQPVEGKNRCVFHPSSEDDTAAGDAVEEFLAIVNGEQLTTDENEQDIPRFIGAKFDNFEISCDKLGGSMPIDLRHAEVGQFRWEINTIASAIDARGLRVEHDARFQQSIFDEKVDFRGATFESGAKFKGTTFKNHANFEGTTFGDSERPRNGFLRVTFEDKANFKEAIFKEKPNFFGATFENFANFRDATFESYASFEGTTFENGGRFTEATFNDSVSFSSILFAGYVDFQDAEFDGSVDFRRTTFEGEADLEDLTFNEDVNFTDAKFRDAILDSVSFENQHISGKDGPTVTFTNADLTGASLRAADFTGVDFSNADLTNTNCYGTDFINANLEGGMFTRANLYDADFTNAHLYGTLFSDAQISDGTKFIDSGTWWTWIPGITSGMETVLDDPRTPPTSVSSVDTYDTINPCSRAASIYAQLETLARNNVRTQLASTCFRWRKDMERLRYWRIKGVGTERRIGRRVLATLTNVFTRYGDSPWRVVGWSCLTMLLSALLLRFGTSGIKHSSFANPTTEMSQLLYFSVVTFTTLGYGDYQPAGPGAQRIASIESLVGAVLIAMLVAVLGRRATR